MIELKVEKLQPRNNSRIVEEQKGLCASCGSTLKKNVFGRPFYHYCRYLGSLHCQKCIKKDKAIIPARVIHELDCNHKKVSLRAKKYLDRMEDMPCISLKMFSAEILARSKELRSLAICIDKLRHIGQFIEICRYREAHYQQLNDQHIDHLLQSNMLTIGQVVGCIKGDFLRHLELCIAKLVWHIKLECTLCKLRGHFCEICKQPRVIYSFDVQHVVQCGKCLNIFHRDCWEKHDLESGLSCPKCLRKESRRIRRASSRINSSESDGSYSH